MDRSGRTWEEVLITGGLCDGINNIDDYDRKYEENSKAVTEYLDFQGSPYLKSDQILDIHRHQFQDLTTFAGHLHHKQNNFGEFVGALKEDIHSELLILDKQMEKLWDAAKASQDKVRAIAFQHARLIGIHGFTDGNGRVGRIAMNYACARMEGYSLQNDVDRSDYIQANNTALKDNNIGRLAQVLASRLELPYDEPDLHVSPYKIGPPMVEEQSFYENTIISHPSTIRESGNTVNQWFKKGALPERSLERFADAANLKLGDREVIDSYIDKMKEPQAIGEAVDLIRSFSESKGVKKKLFGRVDQDGLKETVIEHFSRACRFAPYHVKMDFHEAVSGVMDGSKNPAEIDSALKVIKTAVVATPCAKPAAARDEKVSIVNSVTPEKEHEEGFEL